MYDDVEPKTISLWTRPQEEVTEWDTSQTTAEASEEGEQSSQGPFLSV